MILGTWAALYVITAVTVAQLAPGGCGAGSGAVLALIPALLSFVGAMAVGWWSRPSRPRRRRRA